MVTTDQIKNIANIWPGYPFRSSLKEIAGDEIYVIQAKDVLDME